MKTKILILLVGIALAAPAAGFGAGSSTALFLRQQTTARTTAMGGAGAALYDDAGAVYLNPAGLGFMEQDNVSLTSWRGLDGQSRETFLSGVYHAGKPGVFSLNYLSNETGEEQVFDLSGAESRVTLASEYALGAGWGRKVWGPDVSVGVQAKYVKSELVEAYSDKTLTFDAGVQARTRNGRFSFGAGVQNVGGGLKYLSENEDLPGVLYAGAAARFKTGAGRLTAAADVQKPRDRAQLDQRLGLEYSLIDIVALRVGVKRVDKENSLTLGGGFLFNWLSFDYSYEPAGDRLNQQTHKFTVSLLFGGAAEPAAAAAAAPPGAMPPASAISL